MKPGEPSRTPLATGLEWASRVTTLGLEFALPTLAGWWLDSRYGTRPWGTLLGTLLGFAVGTFDLIRIARSSSRAPGAEGETDGRSRT